MSQTDVIAYSDRETIVNRFVVNEFIPRITTLREAVNHHWLSAMQALFGVEYITEQNAFTRALYTNRYMLNINNDSNMDFPGENLRMREIKTLVMPADGGQDLNFGHTLFNNLPSSSDGGSSIDHITQDAFNEAVDSPQVELPIPMLHITNDELPEDHDSMCALHDPETYDDSILEFSIRRIVPLDCTTRRTFAAQAEALAADIKKLQSAVQTATNHCTTAADFLAVSADFEPFIGGEPPTVQSMNDLLAAVRAG